MRTTIDIPEHLLRRAKATAIMRGIPFKQLLAEYVELGLASSNTEVPASISPPPKRRLPPPTIKSGTGTPTYSLTNQQIEEIFLEEDIEKMNKSSRTEEE